MRSVEFRSSAARELRNLPAAIQSKIIPLIDGLRMNPRPTAAKKLRGPGGYFRLRLGDYRIVYRVDDRCRSILVTRIRHRKDAYR